MKVPKTIILRKQDTMSTVRFKLITERIVKDLEELGVKVERSSTS